LLVVAIASVLLALLMAALSRAKDRARLVQCLSNLHQVHLTVAAYAVDHKNQFVCPKVDTY